MSDRDCENCKHHTEKGCDSWDCEFERKVTRKEAIKVFEDMKKGIYPYDPNVYLDIAINSLEIDERYELEYEQIEPCDDAISRQAVQDYIAKYLSQFLYNDVREAVEVIDEYIGELPSVNPQEPKTDVLDKIRDEIKRLHYHPKLDFIENDAVVDIALEIIDKYKAESEE